MQKIIRIMLEQSNFLFSLSKHSTTSNFGFIELLNSFLIKNPVVRLYSPVSSTS
jgi:hypothetical protein